MRSQYGTGTVSGAEEVVPESEFSRLRDTEKIPGYPQARHACKWKEGDALSKGGKYVELCGGARESEISTYENVIVRPMIVRIN